MDVPVVDANIFRCKVAGCDGNMIINFPPEVKLIGCPRCGVFNCRNCNAVHTGMTCRQYHETRQNEPAVPQPVIHVPQANRNPAPVIQRPVERPAQRIAQPANAQQPVVAPIRPVVLPQPVVPRKVQANVLDGVNFNCKNGACPGYLNLKNIDNIKLIACPVCSTFNCYPCQAVHTGMNCKQYRTRIGLPDNNLVLNQMPLVATQQNMARNPRTNTTAELLAMDEINLIVNTVTFECTVCYEEVTPSKGVIMRSCGHEFCKICLAGAIENNERAVIPCLSPECSGALQDREIRELVTPEIFGRYTKRSLMEAQIPGLFMCRTADCDGMWCIEENEMPNAYRCGMCKQLNCHKCKAIHENMTCAMYQENYANQKDPNVLANLRVIAEQLKNGEIMKCPGCAAMVFRDEGCSWIKCSSCGTEICWATRGPRWGPKGQNDTSGGCKCDYKQGKKCHPDCNYCH